MKSKQFILITLALFVLYYILNIIFPTNYVDIDANAHRIYPQIVMAVLTLWIICICILKSRLILMNRFFYPYIALVLLAFIYILYPFKPVLNIEYFLKTYMGILSMFVMYIFYIHNSRATRRAIFIIFFFQILFCITSLIQDKMDFTEGNSVSELFDSNAGFLLVSCIPLSLLLPNKSSRIYIYAFLILACIYTGQRSASLCAILSVPFALKTLYRNLRKKDLIILFFLAIALSPLLFTSIQNLIARNQLDADKGTIGSGRSIFWLMVINGFLDGNIFQILFGNGTNSVASLIEAQYGLSIGAHNGWLDILYTFGILGFSILAIIIFQFIIYAKKIRKEFNNEGTVLLILFIIYFFKASTSHGYPDISMIPFFHACSIIIGEYTLSLKYKTHEKNNIH